GLLDEFRNGTPGADVAPLIQQAEALARTAAPAAGDAPAATVDTAAAITDTATAAADTATAATDAPVTPVEAPAEASAVPATAALDDLADVEAQDQGSDQDQEIELGDADLVDEDILEVFIEEAGEVL